MLEKRQINRSGFPAFILALPFAVDVNARFLNLAEDALVAKVERELLLVNALKLEGETLSAAA